MRKDKRLSIVLPKELYDYIKGKAKKDDRSKGSVIRKAIDQMRERNVG